MSLYHRVVEHEVFPATGCTEPVACAYAAALAADRLGADVEAVTLRTDAATFKNGAAVAVPCSGGAHGNLIAAVLGACVANPAAKLEILERVTPAALDRATALYRSGACVQSYLRGQQDFCVDVLVQGGGHSARCVLAGGHTHIARIEYDGTAVFQSDAPAGRTGTLPYRRELQSMPFVDVLGLAEQLGDAEFEFLEQGITMNKAMVVPGLKAGGVAGQLQRMQSNGYLADDLFTRVKLAVAAAVDARMGGVAQPVMTSGGSGNQGIVVTLSIDTVGAALDVDRPVVLRSVAAAHLTNAYVKCAVGELAAVCGCAVAGGLGAAVGLVYMRAGIDMPKITHAVNNVIGDLSGLICDGAKPGCALKAVSSVDSALRSAFMALDDRGLSTADGIAGQTVEEAISNIGRLAAEGMPAVDPLVLSILASKRPAE